MKGSFLSLTAKIREINMFERFNYAYQISSIGSFEGFFEKVIKPSLGPDIHGAEL